MKIELLTGAASAQPQLRGMPDALLQNGDIVKALVTKAGEDGQLLISLGEGNTLKALAAPGMNLTAGERLVLQVCKEGAGKTQMQILARDGAAAQAINCREDTTQPRAAQGNTPVDTKKSMGNSAQAASEDAVLKLCRLVAQAPGIGKALQKAVQALQERPASAKEALPPGIRENQSFANTAAPGAEAPRSQAPGMRAEPEILSNAQKQTPEQAAVPVKQPAAGPMPGPAVERAAYPQHAKADATGIMRDNAQSVPASRVAEALSGAQGAAARAAVPEENAMLQQDIKTPDARSGTVSAPAQDGAGNTPATTTAAPPDPRETLIRDVKALFVRPDAPDFDGEGLKRQMESLERRLAELGQKAPYAGDGGKALGAQLETYTAQIRQLDHIQQFTYLQIPVMLHEKESTAELYVFHRDKHGKPASPGATVVMLVLDTRSMGKVESVVRAEDKNVHIRMRVENEQVAQMFEGKTVLLDRALGEAGYTLTRMACSVADAPVSPQNAQETAINLLKDGTRRLDVVI